MIFVPQINVWGRNLTSEVKVRLKVLLTLVVSVRSRGVVEQDDAAHVRVHYLEVLRVRVRVEVQVAVLNNNNKQQQLDKQVRKRRTRRKKEE